MQTRLAQNVGLALTTLFASGLAMTRLASAQESDLSAELSENKLAKLVAEMQKEVEALRGRKYKHPVKAALYTQEELRTFIQRESASEDAEREQASSEASMKMIGLIPPDSNPAKTFEEAMKDFVPGLYDHKTKTLGVVKRQGTDYDSLVVRVMIAHELVHALDDQYYDFEGLMADHATSDASFALGAVVEGSAVTLQERYERKEKRSENYDPARLEEARRVERERMRALFEAPPFVRTMFLARFPCGIRFLQRGDITAFARPDGPKAVEAEVRTALTNPPRSSEQILHPEKYWQDEQQDEPIIVNDEDVERLLLAEGLHVVHKDTIGELYCAVLTSPEDKKFNFMTMMIPGGWTNEAATGWGGDRFFLLATEPVKEEINQASKNLQGVWLTMWDTPEDRDEFVERYEMHRALPSRTLLKLGDLGAVFFFAFEDTRRRTVEGCLQASPPAFTRGGRPWVTIGRVGAR